VPGGDTALEAETAHEAEAVGDGQIDWGGIGLEEAGHEPWAAATRSEAYAPPIPTEHCR
jgi:hypothetical protein